MSEGNAIPRFPSVVDAVFENFLRRVEQDSTFGVAARNALRESLLVTRRLKADQLKTALTAEDEL
jgi:hypothetical protein